MSIFGIPYNFYQRISKHGLRRGLPRAAGESYAQLTRSFDGENVLDREWDVLIILDACRYDRFVNHAADGLPIEGDVGTISSVASCTPNWMRRTFSDRPETDLENLGYVSANPYSKLLPESLAFQIDLWESAWDEEIGTVRPRAVTDTAITTYRERDIDRLIVHYLQPHAPFISNPKLSKTAKHFDIDSRDGMGTWHQVQAGTIPSEDVIAAYESDLELVANEVSLLLENLAAENAVVTADHGELFGEFGIYGHPWNVPLEPLVQVPWVIVSAEDSETHDPESHRTQSDIDREDKLRALGYL